MKLKHHRGQDSIDFFWGIGPTISLAYVNNYNESTANEGDENNEYFLVLNESISSDFDLGLISAVGVEWYFHKKMSLSAEYCASVRLGYRYQQTKLIHERDRGSSMYNEKRVYKNDGPYLKFYSNVLFGLAVFF